MLTFLLGLALGYFFGKYQDQSLEKIKELWDKFTA